MPPVGVKFSRPDRWPSWNTQTSTPSAAAREIALVRSALTGTTTEPVIRNSRTSVVIATIPIAIGARSTTAAVKSIWEAA